MTNIIYLDEYRMRRRTATTDWTKLGLWAIALTFNFGVWYLALRWVFSR